MDKNTYETYELLTHSNTDAQSDQLLVVRDDGTFFINRCKDVQGDVQACTVYDIPSQQYFVNVDNSTELISVPDLELPDGENNIYTSSYLLQPSTSTDIVQMEEDVEVYKPNCSEDVHIDIINQTNKQTSDCTEITLSDEQYQILEQKGWILLESNDKIFVLDTLGLHDITTNDKLIQKLRNEFENNINDDIDGSTGEIFVDAINIQESSNQQNVGLVTENDTATNNEDNVEDSCSHINNTEDETQHPCDEKKDTLVPTDSNTLQNNTAEIFIEQDSSTIRIKTKFTFADIPDKIVLGKTSNGKQLVAKVVKSSKPVTVYEKIKQNQHLNNTDLNEFQFISLVQFTMRCKQNVDYCMKDVVAAEAIVVQLVKLPALKQSIVGQNLFVTKITYSKDEKGNMNCKSKPMIVMGQIFDHGGFIPLPNLLRDLLNNADTKSEIKNGIKMVNTDSAKHIDITHVHASETVGDDNIVRVNVNLVRRQLAINAIFDSNTRNLRTYACGACASTFNTTEDLKEHQENQCMESDDNATIDSDNLNKTIDIYTITNNKREHLYCCSQCHAKFTKISNCQNHIKTHILTTDTVQSVNMVKDNQGDERKGKPQNIYKCKMCPGIYFHPSTLSKHIVSKHIKIK